QMFVATDDTGLYGKLINQIGDLKYHRKENADKFGDSKLSGKDNMGSYSKTNFLLEDKEIIEILDTTVKIYESTKNILTKDEYQQVMDYFYPIISPLLSLSGFIGISFNNITKDSLGSVIDALSKIAEAMIDFKPSGSIKMSSASELDKYLNDSIKHTTVDKLRTLKPSEDTTNDDQDNHTN